MPDQRVNILVLSNDEGPDEVMVFPSYGVSTNAQLADAAALGIYAEQHGYKGENVDYWVFTAKTVKSLEPPNTAQYRATLDPRSSQFRVHRAGCRDLQDPRRQHDNGVMDVKATTAEDIAAELNQDFIGEGMTREEALQYVDFLPCTGL